MTYTYKLSRRLAASDRDIRTLWPLVLLLLLLATACGKGDLVDPHTPDAERAPPGWVSLNPTTPRGDDGAVQMSVLGPAMHPVQLSYVATVDQATARETYPLQDLSQGYAAGVTR